VNPLRGASARNLLGPVVRAAYRVRVAGAHLVPREGGVLLLSTYAGITDPTLLATNLTRPVAVLVGEGSTPVGLRSALGRIVVSEQAPGAGLREAAALLDNGHAVAVFPEGCAADGPEHGGFAAGAAYLQARTGVPVVPVAIAGSTGPRPTDPPRPRSIIDIVVGEPLRMAPVADPLVRSEVVAVAEQLRQHFSDHVREARLRTGRLRGGLPNTAEGSGGHNGAL